MPGRAGAAPGTRNPSKPLIVQSSQAIDAAAAGRARMAAGDCNGALDAFDQALVTSLDPTVRRDRGICHEKLGQPYPAIDDYRAYLVNAPHAPDVDAIRTRLDGLESQTHTAGRTSTVGMGSPEDAIMKNATVSAGVTQSPTAQIKAANDASAAASSDSASPTYVVSPNESTDQIEADELYDQDAKNSSLRRGKGFVIGPYFQYRKWGLSDNTLGAGYGVGASFRQSMSQVSTLMLELGYVSYASNPSASIANLTQTLGDQRGGFGMTLAYEARLRLDAHVTNAILLVGGGELNQLVYKQTNATFTTVMVRGRLGYRHVFGPAFGLEAGLDASLPVTGSGSALDAVGGGTAWRTPLVGLYVALVVGF